MMSPFWRYSSVLLIGYLPFIGILESLYDQNTIRKLQVPEIARAHAQAPEMTSLTSDNFFFSFFKWEKSTENRVCDQWWWVFHKAFFFYCEKRLLLMARNMKRNSNLVRRTIVLCKEASIIRMLIVYFFIQYFWNCLLAVHYSNLCKMLCSYMEPGVLLKHIGRGTEWAQGQCPKVSQGEGIQHNYKKFTHLLLHMDFIWGSQNSILLKRPGLAHGPQISQPQRLECWYKNWKPNTFVWCQRGVR